MATNSTNQQTNIILISGNDATLRSLISIIQKSGNPDELVNSIRHVVTESTESETEASCKRLKTDLTCVICEAQCSGFNYNVISCESCKVFFYRNGSQNVNNLKCLTGSNKCNITFKNRRRMCIRCRLERCRLVGMKRHYSDEEEKLNKQRQLEENRRSTNDRSTIITQANFIDLSRENDNQINSKPTTTLESRKEPTIEQRQTTHSPAIPRPKTISQDFLLTLDDYHRLNSVKLSYQAAFSQTIAKCDITELDHVIDRRSALLYVTSVMTGTCVKLITFIRNIPEFELLNEQDRLILFKDNSSLIFATSACQCYDTNKDLIINLETESEEYAIAKKQLLYYFFGKQFNIQFSQMLRWMKKITEGDPIILQLMMAILTFVKGISVEDIETNEQLVLLNSKHVYETQSIYTSLLFRYMIKKYSSYYQAARQYSQLIHKLIQMQTLVPIHRQIVREQLVDIKDEDINPVFKSILQLR